MTRKEMNQKIHDLPPRDQAKAFDAAIGIYQGKHQHYSDKPVEFMTSILDDFLWSKQVEIVEAVKDHRRVAVHSCHDTGKSFIAGRIVAWFVAASEKSFVVTTAPTMDQVKAILWKEIRRAATKGQLPGKLNITEWKINDELVALGRKPADWDPAAFQGYHELQVLVIIDEASGVPEAIFDAASSLITNEDCRMLAIGNPDDPTSKFARVCRPGSGWHVVHIGWEDTPNHPDSTEEVPDRLRKLLISQIWVDERTEEWGETDPRYISKVLGLFPEDMADGVVPLSLLMKCAEPWDYPVGDLLPVELGVDVGAGGDETNIRERRGRKVGRVWRGQSPDTMVSVGLVLRVIQETGATSVKIDVIGIGKGLTDRLKELKEEGVHSAEIHGVNVGSGALSPTEHQNLRCQIWWDIGRGLSQDRIWDFSGLDEGDRDTLFGQMIAVKRRPPDSAGRNRIEAKIETKKTLGRSPDDADALLLAFFVPPVEIEEGWVTEAEPAMISPV